MEAETGHGARPDVPASTRALIDRSFREGLAASAVPVAAATVNGHILQVNTRFAELVDRDAAALVGIPLQEVLDPVGGGGAPHLLATGLDLSSTECRFLRRDGTPGEVRTMTSVVRDGDRQALYLVVALSDLTEQRQQAEEFAAQTKLLERIARREHLEDVLGGLCRSIEERAPGTRCTVLLLSPDGKTVRHGAAPSLPDSFRRAVDGAPIGPKEGSCGAAMFTGEEVVAENIETHAFWHEWGRVALPLGLRACWSTPLMSTDPRPEDRRVLGSFAVYWGEPHIPSADERRLVGRAADITAIAIERHQAEQALRHASLTDPLTGLGNRRLFLSRLAIALGRAREERASVAVLYLDLDAFKRVNDSMGHDVGDQLLCAVGARLEGVVRPMDTVARIGGDEFAILCEDVADLSAARALAERARSVVDHPFKVGGHELFATVSIGVAIGSSSASSDRLVEDADAAMYQAKAKGRARVEIFDDELRELASGRLRVENALRHALARDEFSVHYQPVVEIATGRLTAVEALLRWTSADLGPIAPADFIPVAEHTGLIGPIGQWVLDEACRQHAAWRAEHGHAPRVAINVSPGQLANRGFVASIVASLARHDVPIDALRFELSETALADPMTDHDLEEMSRLGAQLSIDDFGTGHSSLARLKSLAIYELKIDGTFVHDLDAEPHDTAVVTAIIRMASALGLDVVAEGVETTAQLGELWRLGCRRAQGYLYARPAAPETFRHLLEGHLWEPGA